MTRDQFVTRATREAEKKLGVPTGWWGTYRDVRGPGGERVFFSSGAWTVLGLAGRRLGRSDSRTNAIRRAVRG